MTWWTRMGVQAKKGTNQPRNERGEFTSGGGGGHGGGGGGPAPNPINEQNPKPGQWRQHKDGTREVITDAAGSQLKAHAAVGYTVHEGSTGMVAHNVWGWIVRKP